MGLDMGSFFFFFGFFFRRRLRWIEKKAFEVHNRKQLIKKANIKNRNPEFCRGYRLVMFLILWTRVTY